MGRRRKVDMQCPKYPEMDSYNSGSEVWCNVPQVVAACTPCHSTLIRTHCPVDCGAHPCENHSSNGDYGMGVGVLQYRDPLVQRGSGIYFYRVVFPETSWTSIRGQNVCMYLL